MKTTVPNLLGNAGKPKARVFGPLFLTVWCLASSAIGAETSATRLQSPADISFRNELQRAMDRGLAWLRANQNSNGWWSTPDHPAVAALALMTFQGNPPGAIASASLNG